MCALHSLEAAEKVNIICKSRLKWVGPLKINGHSPYNSMLQVCLSLMRHSTRRHPRQAFLSANAMDEVEIQQVQHGHLDVQGSCVV